MTVAGKNLNNINDSERGLLRNKYLGFVFQFHHLLGEFTAIENSGYAAFHKWALPQEAAASAEEMLKRVGLLVDFIISLVNYLAGKGKSRNCESIG